MEKEEGYTTTSPQSTGLLCVHEVLTHILLDRSKLLRFTIVIKLKVYHDQYKLHYNKFEKLFP